MTWSPRKLKNKAVNYFLKISLHLHSFTAITPQWKMAVIYLQPRGCLQNYCPTNSKRQNVTGIRKRQAGWKNKKHQRFFTWNGKSKCQVLANLQGCNSTKCLNINRTSDYVSGAEHTTNTLWNDAIRESERLQLHSYIATGALRS